MSWCQHLLENPSLGDELLYQMDMVNDIKYIIK